MEYYGDSRRSPQYYDLIKDSDGRIFINYLNIVFIAGYDSPYDEELMKHKYIIEEKLDTFNNNRNILHKYLWVACYHNYFCNQHAYYFGENYKLNIPPSKYVFHNIE